MAWRDVAIGALVSCATSLALAQAAGPAWPPAPETQVLIDSLRRTIGDPAATAGERHAAREKLVRLLMHPDTKAGPALAPMVPRAAIDPARTTGRPATAAPVAGTNAATTAGVAIRPVAPPVRAPDPAPDGRGGVVVPAGAHAVDPKTGALLLDAGNGWVDPATGRFVPKN